MKGRRAQFETVEDYSILFADIKGFSDLQPYQQRQFLREVLNRISEVVQRVDASPEYVNTWGDGLVAFFKAQTRALHCALHLRDVFRSTSWSDFGLPNLKIRIALHAGEIFEGFNPVTGRTELIGREVNRAARIEPVTMPNHVYASRAFVVRCSTSDHYQFKSLGAVDLPKGAGQEELFVVGWAEHEQLNCETSSPTVTDLTPESLRRVLSFSSLASFGNRLEVSWRAKAIIARFFSGEGFWRAEDGVFLESGTLPVYLIAEMYRRLETRQRPRLIVTNNLGCAMLAITGIEGPLSEALRHEPSYWVFPADLPSAIILTNGIILGDYAATVPSEFFESNEGGSDAPSAFSYLEGGAVSHVVMMVSRISLQDGPCAASVPMRRFKKRLLEIVAGDPKKRLTICFEAEKISGRRGWPACSVDEDDIQLWPRLLGSGRVTLLCAYAEDTDDASIGLAKREMAAMQDAGAVCILLDEAGEPVKLAL